MVDEPDYFDMPAGTDHAAKKLAGAAAEGKLTFYGVPSQTEFLFRKSYAGPEKSLYLARSNLLRQYLHPRDHPLHSQTHLATRYIMGLPVPIPANCWIGRSSILSWVSGDLFLLQGERIDAQFDGKDITWHPNPNVTRPSFDPIRISGYSHIFCPLLYLNDPRVQSIHRAVERNDERSSRSSHGKVVAGRPSRDWTRINSAARKLIERDNTWTWAGLLEEAKSLAYEEGASPDEVEDATHHGWIKHLERSDDGTRLLAAIRRKLVKKSAFKE